MYPDLGKDTEIKEDSHHCFGLIKDLKITLWGKELVGPSPRVSAFCDTIRV